MGNSQSLPDFLTDGPVRPGSDSIPISPTEPLSTVNIRPESCRRCLELRSELAIAHQRVSVCQEEADRSNVCMVYYVMTDNMDAIPVCNYIYFTFLERSCCC